MSMSSYVRCWLFAILVLTGCDVLNPAPTALPTGTPPPALVTFPTPPSGWRIHATPTFQLALPPSWLPVNLSEESIRATIQQSQPANPDLARALQDVLDSGQYKSLSFYAADSRAAAPVTSLTVAHTAPGAGAKVEDLAKKDAEALVKIVPGIRVIGTTPLAAVNGMGSAQLEYELPISSPGGTSFTLRGVQFLFLVSPQDLYVLTATANAENGEFAAVAEQIGKSFVAVKK